MAKKWKIEVQFRGGGTTDLIFRDRDEHVEEMRKLVTQWSEGHTGGIVKNSDGEPVAIINFASVNSIGLVSWEDGE